MVVGGNEFKCSFGKNTADLLVNDQNVYTLEQGEKGFLTIAVLSEKPFPSGTLKMYLQIKSNERSVLRRLRCAAAAGGRAAFKINTSHSGVTAFELRRFWATSLLGLGSIPIPSRSGAAVLILPAPVKPPRLVSLPRAVPLRPKPGGGFSEEHDLRPYRFGDPVKTVHWKLSAKHDSLIVREALSPPPHGRLISAAQWSSAEELDLILGRLLWVSAYLLERGLHYYVKLGEHCPVSEITEPEDLIKYLYHTLFPGSGAAGMETAAQGGPSAPERFTWVFKVDAADGETS